MDNNSKIEKQIEKSTWCRCNLNEAMDQLAMTNSVNLGIGMCYRGRMIMSSEGHLSRSVMIKSRKQG